MDVSGNLTTNTGAAPQLYGNDVIGCNGGNTSRYAVQQYANGQPAGPLKYYYISSTQGFNLNTATPIATIPPLKPLAPGTCPAGTYITGWDPSLAPKCANLPGASSNAVVVNPVGTQNVAQPNGTLLNVQGYLLSQRFTTSLPKVDVTHPDFAGGADPNGFNDSTAAIEAAVTFATSQVTLNGGPPCVYLPHGVYRISSSINLPAGACLVGDGPNTSILQLVDGNENAITITNHTTLGLTYARTFLSRFAIVGDGSKTTGTMIEVVSTINVDMENIHLLNHGGRGINQQNDSERINVEDVSISHVRMPIVNWGGNETYYRDDKIEDPGQDNNNYCWSVNCVNGVYPASGVIVPDPHFAVSLFADNLEFSNSSVKSTQMLNGINIAGNNGTIKNIYSEGFPFNNQPRINSSIIIGPQIENFTLSAAVGTNDLTVPLVDDSWAIQFVNDPANLWTNAQVNYDIHCADANPNSTALCAGSTTLHQNSFERVSVIGFTGDKNVHIASRCVASSTGLCTAGTGVAWPANAVMSTVPAAGNGTVTIQDNHLISDSAAGSGAYSSNCDESQLKFCGEVIVGVKPDNVEVSVVGGAFAGHAGSFAYQAFLINNGFREYVFNNGSPDYIHGAGVIKVPGSGTIQNIGLSNSTLIPTAAIANAPHQMATRQFAVEFSQYSGGGTATGFFEDSASHTLMSPDQNYFVTDYRSTNPSYPGIGRIFSNSNCDYDATLTTRICESGGPNDASGWEFDQLVNGSWKSAFSFGSNGASSNPTLGPAMGLQQQLVANSSNVADASWFQLIPSNAVTVTGGISDPTGSTSAYQITFGSAPAIESGLLTGAGATLTSGPTTVVSGMWMRSCSGTMPVVWGFKDGGANIPSAPADTVTTTWQQFSHQAISGFVYPYVPQFVIAVTNSPGACIQVYAPQANQGVSLSRYIATTGTPVLAMSSYLSAQALYANNFPVASLSANGNTTISTNQACGGTPAAGTYCDGGTDQWTALAQGAAIQSGRATGCSTPVADGATCTTTVSWPSAFADANYNATCTGIGPTSGSTSAPAFVNLVGLQSKSASGVVVITGSLGSGQAASFATINCIGIHP